MLSHAGATAACCARRAARAPPRTHHNRPPAPPPPLAHHSIVGSTEGLASYILLAAHGTGAAELERDVVMKGADWSPFQLEGRTAHLYLTAEDDDQVGRGVGGLKGGEGATVGKGRHAACMRRACVHAAKARSRAACDGGVLSCMPCPSENPTGAGTPQGLGGPLPHPWPPQLPGGAHRHRQRDAGPADGGEAAGARL